MPSDTSSCPVADIRNIIILERIREDDEETRAYIEEELAPSIATHGIIHPIILNKLPEKISGINLLGETIVSDLTLIAGWSRCNACLFIDKFDIPYNIRENLTPVELLQIEAEENLRRRPMAWYSTVLAIYRTHMLHKQEANKNFQDWSQRATGNLLGINKAKVTYALLIGEALLAGDEEVLNATSMDNAQQILLKRKEEKLAAQLRENTLNSAIINKVPIKTIEDTDMFFFPSNGKPPSNAEILAPSEVGINLTQLFANESSVYPVSNWQNFQQSLSEARADTGWMSKLKEDSVDCVFTDIPFGIDMGNLDLVTQDQVEDEHDVDENIAQFLPFLYQAYRVLKEKTYCIFFYDIKHQEKLADFARSVGFDVMPYPIIWHKTSSVKNRAAYKWWPKKIEYIMVLAKKGATLKDVQTDNLITASSDAERKKFGHPFAKPWTVCKTVLEPIAFPGMVIADPYAGSGSMVSASISLGLSPIGCEKKPEHYNLLLENLKTSYQNRYGSSKLVFS